MPLDYESSSGHPIALDCCHSWSVFYSALAVLFCFDSATASNQHNQTPIQTDHAPILSNNPDHPERIPQLSSLRDGHNPLCRFHFSYFPNPFNDPNDLLPHKEYPSRVSYCYITLLTQGRMSLVVQLLALCSSSILPKRPYTNKLPVIATAVIQTICFYSFVFLKPRHDSATHERETSTNSA